MPEFFVIQRGQVISHGARSDVEREMLAKITADPSFDEENLSVILGDLVPFEIRRETQFIIGGSGVSMTKEPGQAPSPPRGRAGREAAVGIHRSAQHASVAPAGPTAEQSREDRAGAPGAKPQSASIVPRSTRRDAEHRVAARNAPRDGSDDPKRSGRAPVKASAVVPPRPSTSPF